MSDPLVQISPTVRASAPAVRTVRPARASKHDETAPMGGNEAHRPAAAFEAGTLTEARAEAALVAVQQWLHGLYGQGLAAWDAEEGAVRVGTQVARQFAFGRAQGRAFLAFSPRHAPWSRVFAWSHAATRRGAGDLYVLAHPVALDGVPHAPLALHFALPNATRARELAELGVLDLRELGFTPGDEPGTLCSAPFGSIPVRMLDPGEAVVDGAPATHTARRAMGR